MVDLPILKINHELSKGNAIGDLNKALSYYENTHGDILASNKEFDIIKMVIGQWFNGVLDNQKRNEAPLAPGSWEEYYITLKFPRSTITVQAHIYINIQ